MSRMRCKLGGLGKVRPATLGRLAGLPDAPYIAYGPEKARPLSTNRDGIISAELDLILPRDLSHSGNPGDEACTAVKSPLTPGPWGPVAQW